MKDMSILDSIVVSIPACHAGDRGSIPRRGVILDISPTKWNTLRYNPISLNNREVRVVHFQPIKFISVIGCHGYHQIPVVLDCIDI